MSKELGFIMYSNLLLVIFNTRNFVVTIQLMNPDSDRVRSLIYSADVITSILT